MTAQRVIEALFISDPYNNSWVAKRNDKSQNMRRFALFCKTKGIVTFDRVICNDRRFLDDLDRLHHGRIEK